MQAMGWQQIHDPLSSMTKSRVAASTVTRGSIGKARSGAMRSSTRSRWPACLACMFDLYVAIQAPVWPFTLMVVHGPNAAKVSR